MKIAKLLDRAVLPTRKHPTDAGIDLYAYVEDPDTYLCILGGGSAIIHTGVTLEIPEGYAGFVWPKSRNNHLIGGGVVDQGYQGEILVKVMNSQTIPVNVYHGDAIAQLVLTPVITPEVFEVPLDQIHLKESTRGKTGGIVSEVNNVEH
jgi:dUTP pyrophosphatase